jgi:hypothetical protein
MGKCCIVIPLVVWEDILAFGTRNWRSKSLAASLCKLSWSVAVYHLWRLRNAIKYGSHQISADKLLLNASL